MVIDWRAPVSRPFYRASPATPMGLSRRRRFGFSGAELTAYEDEHFAPVRPAGAATALPDAADRQGAPITSRIVVEEIERPRVGPMRDIVATIQPDQDDIVRAEPGQTVCVQGAPGTGKTAVGLHRVAYLLYAYPERMRRGGVLVVGPNRAFLSYIRGVLPALGEMDVSQAGEAAAEDDPDARLAIVPVTLAKGLEFDQVIVVEPAAITGTAPSGLRRLYVALTRAVSRLFVLHTEPLPAPLR
jgi:DNA helicase IV